MITFSWLKGFLTVIKLIFVVSATIKAVVKLQTSVIWKTSILTHSKNKQTKNEVIFILHTLNYSYDTSKNFSKRRFRLMLFLKIFLNNYSAKHSKKNLLLKNFKGILQTIYWCKYTYWQEIKNYAKCILKKLFFQNVFTDLFYRYNYPRYFLRLHMTPCVHNM